MYVANHHVRLNGRRYLPGEVIEGEVPEETAEWWLSVGAIQEIEGAAAPVAPPPPPPPADPAKVPEGGAFPEDPEDADEPQNPDEPEAPEDPEDEIDDDAAPEEIDVTAGIVAEPATEQPKRATRKNGGKKS